MSFSLQRVLNKICSMQSNPRHEASPESNDILMTPLAGEAFTHFLDWKYSRILSFVL